MKNVQSGIKNKLVLLSCFMLCMLVVSACASSEPAGDTAAHAKEFSLSGENFKFIMQGEENPIIQVKEGDVVRVTLTATEGRHDFVIDEFDAASERVEVGETSIVEFVADKPGTYEYYCSVGQHRANGMFGTLIVEPK